MNRVVRPPGGWGRSWSVVVVMVIAGCEPIWWRHVWLYRESPAGIFSMTNFNVTC